MFFSLIFYNISSLFQKNNNKKHSHTSPILACKLCKTRRCCTSTRQRLKRQPCGCVGLNGSENWSKRTLSIQCQRVALLQRAHGAATFQSSLHFLGVRAAIGAPEDHLPPPGFGDAAANTRGRCGLARPWTIHPGDLAGGRARPEWLVTFELLPHHLSLTR